MTSQLNHPGLNVEIVKTVVQMGTDITFFNSFSARLYNSVPSHAFSPESCISFVDQTVLWTMCNFTAKG